MGADRGPFLAKGTRARASRNEEKGLPNTWEEVACTRHRGAGGGDDLPDRAEKKTEGVP